jgi:hypothetical protein
VTRFKAAAQHSIYSTYMWEKYFSGGFGHRSLLRSAIADDDSSVALRSLAGPLSTYSCIFHVEWMIFFFLRNGMDEIESEIRTHPWWMS